MKLVSVLLCAALPLGASACGPDLAPGDASDDGALDAAGADASTDAQASDDGGSSTDPGSGSGSGDTDDGTTSDTAGGDDPPRTFCEDGEIWPAYFEDQPVPNQTDAYVCRGFTLQTESLRHAIGFAPHIDVSGHVHHMILYKVQNPIEGDTSCFHGADWVFQFGWAPGVEEFILPEEAGFLVGASAGGQTHYVLEVHYYNPQGATGVLDSSGVDVCLTDRLRPNNASVIALGDVPGIEIPPGEEAWVQTSDCPGALTSLLTEPLTVFGSMLHAHKLGRRIYTEQFRGGSKIGELGRDDMFDFNYQKILSIEGTIQPGDSLRTTCVYDSTGVATTTHGGEGSDDEMCLNFLAYYPEIPYPACTIPI
jgi:hypothetical protein